jgi:hypothetical protein
MINSDIPISMYCDGCKFLNVIHLNRMGMDTRVEIHCRYANGHKRKNKKSWRIVKHPDCPSIRFGLHNLEELKKIDHFAHDV